MVISTVSGPEQLNLIVAAGDGRVKYFVPSEFEGSLRHRPKHDPFDRGSKQALDLLKHLEEKKRLKYTIFCCGVLMETFLPYGLGSLGMGYGAGVGQPGAYLLDINNCTAEYSEKDGRKNPVRVCLTSVYDLVRFIVAAIDLGPKTWPNELTLRGDRLTCRDIVSQCSLARNSRFKPPLHSSIVAKGTRAKLGFFKVAFTHDTRQHADLDLYHKHYLRTQQYDRAVYYQRLIATADGRYDFSHAKLNDIVAHSPAVHVRPLTFSQWLASVFELSP